MLNSMVLMLLIFQVVCVVFLCLCCVFVLCLVSNVACVSVLSILDCHVRFSIIFIFVGTIRTLNLVSL
jgi:hypothetical protein